MATIYIDESGNTGTNLFDPQQPAFGLGCTDLNEEEAADIIARCFPEYGGDEIKSKTILKSGEGRRQFLAFAAEVGKTPDRFCAALIDKRFATVSKMIDGLVEPMLRAQGYDFYANDYARRYANMANYSFKTLMAPGEIDPVLKAYNEFARHPDLEAMSNLEELLGRMAAAAPVGPNLFLQQLQMGAQAFPELTGIENFDDTNDIHVTAAVNMMSFWQERYSETFHIVHDESIHFFARAERWHMITDPELPPTQIRLGNKRLTLPIAVASTVSAKSHKCSSLQIADLIAGFVTRARATRQTQDMHDFFVEATNRGMDGLTLFPVEAGDDFIDGPPALATGPDVVDQIAGAVATRGE